MEASTLKETHEDVPPDFYDAGLSTNLIQRVWHRRRLQRISELISKTGGRILDIGCDGITLTEAVAAKTGAKEVVGIDISGATVAYSKRKRPDFHLAIGNGEELPFHETVFDAIVCFEVLEHVEHPERLLSEMRRCLRKDGYGLVIVPTETPLFKFLWFLWTRLGRGKIWRHAHVQDFPGGVLDRLVKETGFRVVEDGMFMLGMLRAMKIVPA